MFTNITELCKTLYKTLTMNDRIIYHNIYQNVMYLIIYHNISQNIINLSTCYRYIIKKHL